MKKLSLYVMIAFLFAACSKGDGGIDPNQLEHYPQTWILTVDQGNDKYTILRAQTPVMYRSDVSRSISLTQLATDFDCEWEVNQTRTEDGSEVCYRLQLKKNKKIRLGATPSSNKQEIHLVASNYDSNEPDDTYSFFIHKMPDVNGVKTVALENVFHKGYYLSNASPGFQYAQNLAILQQASDPAKATAWQCRHN